MIVLVAVSVVAAGLFTAAPAPAGEFNSESFTGNTLTAPSNWSTSNTTGSGQTPYPACLMALGSSAPAISLAGSTTLPGCENPAASSVGSGALRLTKDAPFLSGSIFYKDPQSTTYGLDITFTMAMVSTNSNTALIGNGMSFFIKDGSNATDTTGGAGAPLGYALYRDYNVSSHVAEPGVPGGLLGVGFDVYGAYADSRYFADNGCGASAGNGSALVANMLGVRGPDTSSSKNGTAGYCWINGTSTLGVLYGTSRDAAKRKVRIVVDPAATATPKVRVYVGAAGGGAVPATPTLEFDQPNELKNATTFKFGFSASTGGASLDSYVWDLQLRTQVLYVVPANHTYTYGTNPGTITPTVVYQTTLGDASTNIANPAASNSGWTAPTCSATGSFTGSTNAGTYAGAIGCTGGDGGTRYSLDTTSVANVIVTKANPSCTVNPYTTAFTGAPITATGSCVGVGGATLSGLDLTGTTHTSVGTYATDAWTFTDTTGNYNNASGTMSNTISAPTYTVTYAGNGSTSGSVPVDSAMYASSGTATVLGNTGSLARSGYSFAGWATDAAGTGTLYLPGSAFALSASNVVLYAKWTVSPQEPSATPTPASTPADPLAPLLPAQGAANPAVALASGGAMLMAGGSRVPVTTTPNSRGNPNALLLSAPGLTPPLSMRMEGRGSPDASPLDLTSGQMLVLQSYQGPAQPAAGQQPVLVSSGEGLKPNTPVRVYLLPSTFLGTMTTDARGAFSGTIPVPPGITPGVHIIQVNAFAPDNSIRSVSLPALVKPRTSTVSAIARRIGVPFTALSSQLNSQGKAALRALVRKTGKQAIMVRCYGYVQAGPGKKVALSTARAKAVATYLRKLGVKGAYVVKGNSRTVKGAARANRVNVMITFRSR